LEVLRHYNYIVRYQPGKQNSAADALSRWADHWESAGQPVEFKPFPGDKMIPMEKLELAALDWEESEGEWQGALEWALIAQISTNATLLEEIRLNTQEGDPKAEDERVWVPDRQDLRCKIVALYHDTPITGHLGIMGTYELVS
jgi:hypothetical protein